MAFWATAFDSGMLANVAGDQRCPAAGIGNKTFGLLRIPVFIKIRNGNIRPSRAKARATARPMPLFYRSGNKRVATTHAFIARLFVVDFGTRFLLTTWS